MSATAFLTALIGVAVAYSLYGLGQLKGWYDHAFWANQQLLSSRMVNSTHFAGFLLVPILSCAGLLFSSARWPAKSFAIAALPLLFFTMLLTQSRAGWMSLSAAGLMFLCWLFYARAEHLSARWKIAGIFLLLALMAIGAYLCRDAIADRLMALKATQFQTLTQRWDVWRTTFWVMMNYPLGVGGENLALISPSLKITGERFLIDYAHNEFLQWAVEYGVLGFASVLLVLWFYERRMIGAIRMLRNKPGVMLLHAGLFCGMQGVLVESLVDFPLRIPANAFLFFAAMGFQWGLLNIPRAVPRPARAMFLAFLTGIVLLGVQTHQLLAAEKALANADEAKRMFAWQDATKALTSVNGRITGDCRLSRELGKLLMQRAIVAKDKEQTLLTAREALESAYGLSPVDEDTLLHLAKATEKLGLREEADGWYRLHMQSYPMSKSQWLLGDYLLSQGMVNQGIRYAAFHNLWLEGRTTEDKLVQAYPHVRDYKRLSLLVPEKAIAWSGFAMFLAQKGDMQGFDRAAAHLLMFGEEGRKEMSAIMGLLSSQGDEDRMRALRGQWQAKGMPLP